jgi:hypothetical protein
LASKTVCAACIGDRYLRNQVRAKKFVAECAYCGKRSHATTIGDLSEWIEVAFENHYYLTSPDAEGAELIAIKGGDADFERHGDSAVDAIAEAADISEEVAEDVRQVLEDRCYDHGKAEVGEESGFEDDSYYARLDVDDEEFREGWTQFESMLQKQSRFFLHGAELLLKEIFNGLADHKTQRGRRVIVEAGPGRKLASFIRGRAFRSDKDLEEALKRPDLEIGPPPHTFATAGRMNPHGISVFYGAVEARTAIAEIRPPVGSRVVTGRFELLRPARLLDVAALESVLVKGSIFDPGYRARLEQAKFLRRLSRRISWPVLPGDEPQSYLMTQYIAEYLATEAQLDGILYSSAQGGRGAQNVVLFHQMARVEKMTIPEGAKLSVSLYDHGEDGGPDYWVWVQLPGKKEKTAFDDFPLPDFRFEAGNSIDWNADNRKPALKLDPDSIRVCHVERVEFSTTDFDVKRHDTA